MAACGNCGELVTLQDPHACVRMLNVTKSSARGNATVEWMPDVERWYWELREDGDALGIVVAGSRSTHRAALRSLRRQSRLLRIR